MKNEMNNMINPLFGVRIGSTIKSGTGKFSPPILKAPITEIITDKHLSKSMSGESAYVYTDEMNQGSLCFSGAFGVGALAKLNSAVSSYLGKSSAQSSKAVKVNFNIKMVSGIEYVKFDDLSPENLVNAMQEGPKELLMTAFTHFTNLRKAVSDPQKVLDAISSPDSNKKISELIQLWLKAVNEFHRNYGDGMVVGVIWGGLGTVSLNMINTSAESNWKYGAKANFTWANVTSAVSINAAYDGSQSDKNSQVKVECVTWASGACVQNQVNEWGKIVEGKAFSEICDIKLLEKAPGLEKVPPPPAIPEFAKPKSDPKLTDKFKDLSNLKGLKAYAIASAYDKLSPDEKKQTSLQEFIKKQEANANPGPVNEIQHQVENNDWVMIIEERGQSAMEDGPGYLESAENTPPAASASDDYTVLGTWVASWTDIFPWLATGFLNELNQTEELKHELQKQCMMQDMLTLARIYYMLANSHIKPEDLGFDSFEQVADSFTSTMTFMRNNFTDKDVFANALLKLSASAKKVFDCWNQNSFLRNAELGLGISFEGRYSVTTNIAHVDQSSDDYPVVYYNSGLCTRQINDNNTVFKSFLKGIPVISANNDIYLFGPLNMLLKSVTQYEAGFSKEVKSACKFIADKKTKTLRCGSVTLYPIRFKDAEGLDNWKGQAIGSSLGANVKLISQFKKFTSEFGSMKQLSLTSSRWENNSDWSAQKPFHMQTIPTQYYGIIDAVGNVFNS